MEKIKNMSDLEKVVYIYLDLQILDGKKVSSVKKTIEEFQKDDTLRKKAYRDLAKAYHTDLRETEPLVVDNPLMVAAKFYPEISNMEPHVACKHIFNKITETLQKEIQLEKKEKTEKEIYAERVKIMQNYMNEYKLENPTFLSIMEVAVGKFNQFLSQNISNVGLLSTEFDLIKNEFEGLVNLIRNCILYLSMLPDSIELVQTFKEEAIKIAIKKQKLSYDYNNPNIDAREKLLTNKKRAIMTLIKEYISKEQLTALIIDDFNKKEFEDISEEDMIFFMDLFDGFAQNIESLSYSHIILKPENIESLKEETSKKIGVKKFNLFKMKSLKKEIEDQPFYPTISQIADEELGNLKDTWGRSSEEIDIETFENMRKSYNDHFRTKTTEFYQTKKAIKRKLDEILKGEKYNNLKIRIFLSLEDVTDYASLENFMRWLLNYSIQVAKINVEKEAWDKFNEKFHDGYSEYKEPVLFKLDSIGKVVNNPFQDIEITSNDALFFQIPVLYLVDCVTHLGITDYKAQKMFGSHSYIQDLTKAYNKIYNIKQDKKDDIQVENISKKTHL